MLILAFDTSSKTASVAILSDETVLCDILLNTGQNHSEVLLPAIDKACKTAGVNISDIDLFACTLGPGSFTGLRIGISTLKGLMIAQGKPAVGVSALAALAVNIGRTEKTICSVMDAGRGQVYLASYQYENDGSLTLIGEEKALSPDTIEADTGKDVIYVGEGAVNYADEIRKSCGEKNEFADAEQQFVRASSVGILALKKFSQGDVLDLNRCAPVYLRSADALPPKRILT